MLLHAEDVRKSFGAVAAVSDVSFDIQPGELVALIGPNGAGKTTLFNVISGLLKPDGGRVVMDGVEITSLPAHRIAHNGIGLAFQITNIFPRLTVFQNVQVALFSARGRSGSVRTFGPRALRDEVQEILVAIGLIEFAQLSAGALAQADKKRLEVGIALTTDLIRRINREQALTVLFIEHKMGVVFGIARRVLVMHNGRLIADGDPQRVRQDEQVQRAYLGEVG